MIPAGGFTFPAGELTRQGLVFLYEREDDPALFDIPDALRNPLDFAGAYGVVSDKLIHV